MWIKVSPGIDYAAPGRACTPGGNRAMLEGAAARRARALLLHPTPSILWSAQKTCRHEFSTD
jgi:hypothetical protein